MRAPQLRRAGGLERIEILGEQIFRLSAKKGRQRDMRAALFN